MGCNEIKENIGPKWIKDNFVPEDLVHLLRKASDISGSNFVQTESQKNCYTEAGASSNVIQTLVHLKPFTRNVATESLKTMQSMAFLDFFK